MAGSAPIASQIDQSNVLDFSRSEIFVEFLLDLCDADIKTLSKYYQLALRNSILLRLQNTMRVRVNDKYLDYLDMDIGRLENRWVLPLTKATNVFDSAIKYSDTSPKEVKPNQPDTGIETEPVNKSDIQDKVKWLTEPTIVLLKGVGVQPYMNAVSQLRNLRYRRTQYNYLGNYFLNIGRSIINLQQNLRLIIAVIDFVQKFRKAIASGGQQNSNADIGLLVQEAISGVSLTDAVNKVHELNPQSLLAGGGAGGPAGGDPGTVGGSAASNAANARESIAAAVNNGNGAGTVTSGDVPPQAANPPSLGPTGINTNSGQGNPL